MAFVAVPYFIYASNELKSVLARDLGDCRDNLRNTRSVFLIVGGKVIKNWGGIADYEKQFPPRPCIMCTMLFMRLTTELGGNHIWI